MFNGEILEKNISPLDRLETLLYFFFVFCFSVIRFRCICPFAQYIWNNL